MAQRQFTNQHIYHVHNRGVEKRDIYLEDSDYLRSIHDLWEFNNVERVLNLGRCFNQSNEEVNEVGLHSLMKEVRLHSLKRTPLVEILAFILMPNHYHLLIKQLVDDGISKFMQKHGTGYTNYFNSKRKRSGVLFQGKFKAVQVTSDEQLYHLFFYLHAANPVDLLFPGWREDDIPDYKRAVEFARTYSWSSLPDYLGTGHFPSVTKRQFLTDFIGGKQKIASELEEWLRARERNLSFVGKAGLD